MLRPTRRQKQWAGVVRPCFQRSQPMPYQCLQGQFDQKQLVYLHDRMRDFAEARAGEKRVVDTLAPVQGSGDGFEEVAGRAEVLAERARATGQHDELFASSTPA